MIVVVFLHDGFFGFFLAHPLLAAYFFCRSCVEVLLLPSFVSLAACHKTQTLTILAIHLPTNKVKMRLIYNPSGTSHAHDALRIEQRSKQRRMYTASEKMKIVRAVDAMMATRISLSTWLLQGMGLTPQVSRLGGRMQSPYLIPQSRTS